MPFFSKTPGGITHLVVGLGNPDRKYLNTRHNAGFIAVDEIAASLGTAIDKKKFDALVADVTLAGERVLLMKPQTYMNLSGVAVEKAASFYKIPPEHVIVLFDDISLDVGRVRIRRKGSAGGHNGIRSIIDYLQSDNFPRVKIGVGERPNPNYDLADWVLSTFKEDEKKAIREVASHCREIVELMLGGNVDKAMNLYNS
ncbi:MAG TPA: aminoacyl-tRNA hydrolase [Candidatus Merdivicinus faecavium]|nr:aminoacyl-tRNA hydrolase [Candidatus Merdivicinus faecavium]